MKTRSVKWGIMAMALLSMAMPFTAKAQDKVEASAGVDLVSGYVWRDQDLGGVSLQPSASIAYKGFSLGAWGSVGIESSDTKEFDLLQRISDGLLVQCDRRWGDSQILPVRRTQCCQLTSVRSANRL